MKIPVVLVVSISVLMQIVLLTSANYFFLQGTSLFLSTLFSLVLFIFVDIINEQWGPRITAYVVTAGIFFQGVTIWLALMLGQNLPPLLPVSLLLLGAWCGDLLDTTVYAYMKKRTRERLLWLRVLLSTSCALGVDAVFFIGGVGVPIFTLFSTQLMWKFIALVMSIPLVYIIHHRLVRVVL